MRIPAPTASEEAVAPVAASKAPPTFVAEDRAEDWARIQDIVGRSGTSFYWAIRLLPDAQRRAMFAVYAFCREVDDVADDPGEPSAKCAALTAWRVEIKHLFAGAPRTPVTRMLAPAVRRYGLQEQDFQAVIDGMEMDAAARLRLADRDALMLYCDRVACAVGRLSARIFGADPATADELAQALGRALQLTNILRDLAEDAARNRLYFPLDLLAAHGVIDAAAAGDVLRQPAIPEVCRDVAAMAQRHFDEAAAILERDDRHTLRPAHLMMASYRNTLDALVRRGWQRWADPVRVPRWKKLWIVLRHGLV
jgi:phytoene synthase